MPAETFVTDAPAKPVTPGWLKRALSSGLALIIGLVPALLVGEAAARVAFRTSMDFDMEMWKYATQIKAVTDDPRVGYEQHPNSRAFLMGAEITTNSFGLRDDETTLEKPPDTYRIVAVGDSITLGWGVAQDEAYPAQLERMLNDEPPSSLPQGATYEVLNLGVGNYNTTQEIARLRKVGLPFDPDLILLGYFINDAEPTPQPKRGFLIENSYLYVFAVSRLRALPIGNSVPLTYKEYYRGLYADEQPGWQATQDALAELAEIGRERNIPVMVFIIPEMHDLSAAYPFMDINERLIATGAELSLPVVDLFPVFSGYSPEEELWVSPTDAHHNALAQGMIAQSIYDALEAMPVEP